MSEGTFSVIEEIIGSFDIRCDIAGMKGTTELKKLLVLLFFSFSQKTVNQ